MTSPRDELNRPSSGMTSAEMVSRQMLGAITSGDLAGDAVQTEARLAELGFTPPEIAALRAETAL